MDAITAQKWRHTFGRTSEGVVGVLSPREVGTPQDWVMSSETLQRCLQILVGGLWMVSGRETGCCAHGRTELVPDLGSELWSAIGHNVTEDSMGLETFLINRLAVSRSESLGRGR